MAYNGDGLIQGFEGFYDHPDAKKFMKEGDVIAEVGSGYSFSAFAEFVNEHWDYRIWAVDYICGDRTIGGTCNNLVTLMKYTRLVAYKALAGDGLISSPEDLSRLVQRFHPDVDKQLLEFDKQERFWEHMQNGGYEDAIYTGAASKEEEKTLTDKIIELVESEYED